MKILKTISVLIFSLLFLNISLAGETPQYSDYPAVVMCKPKHPVKLDLSNNREAAAFRSRLETAAKRDPNFAGHYVLTHWGCGTFCQTIAIIDILTGKVYFPEITEKSMENNMVGWGYETPSVDSKLLIINAQLTTGPRSQAGALKSQLRDVRMYFKWEDNQLVRIQ